MQFIKSAFKIKWAWSMGVTIESPTCNKNVCLRFLAPRAFIWYSTRPTLGWWWRAAAPHHKWAWSMGVVIRGSRCHINAFLWFLTSRAFVWYPTWLILSKFEKSENTDGCGPEMTLLHIGWRGKLKGCFWGPIWAPWKWSYIFGNYFPKSSFLCTILLD